MLTLIKVIFYEERISVLNLSVKLRRNLSCLFSGDILIREDLKGHLKVQICSCTNTCRSLNGELNLIQVGENLVQMFLISVRMAVSKSCE